MRRRVHAWRSLSVACWMLSALQRAVAEFVRMRGLEETRGSPKSHGFGDLSRWCAVLLGWLASADGVTQFAMAGESQNVRTDFELNVAPILIRRCLECHNPNEKSGGLDLTTRQTFLAGGESGVIVDLERPTQSWVLKRLASGEMPPPKQGRSRPLPPGEIAVLTAWIEAKAPWPAGRTLDLFERTTDVRAGRDWWSLQPVVRPLVPNVSDYERTTNPIDAFIGRGLEPQRLKPAPAADRRTLIRRASYDVIGLPPTFDEVEEFCRDTSPDAFERLIDRLLASPHYGERWARYWLDVARFAETSGYERDQEKTGIWKYRDWVVDAFNSDKPFDRFVIEQLAGDELPDRSEASVIATGFLAAGTWNDEPNDPEEYKYDRLEDLVHVSTTAFLALTVKCARCHDHKFDPIPQLDYYRIGNAFWAGPIDARDRKFLGGPTREELGFDVFGWTDLSRESKPLYLLKKGDPKHPGPAVAAANLSVVPGLNPSIATPAESSRTTTRRRQLAQWIADPHNPLTPRVFVNRLWQHHFGQGLVRSPDNFGFNGDKPTHPELLDWLADEFVNSGWSVKRLQKLILLSATWQQASVHPDQQAYERVDAQNRWWWRAERRRLDAEALRDSLLAASGQLDRRIGGPSFRPTISAEALEGLSQKAAAWQASPPPEQRRRSLYIYTKRGLLPPLLTTFDFADTTLPCGQRDVSTVAPQALALLNNVFTHEQSTALAHRVASSSPLLPEQVQRAWQHALGRRPTAPELAFCLEYVRRQGAFAAPPAHNSVTADAPDTALRPLAALCHVLLNSNEFVFID